MPKSRALAVITVAFALAGAASGGMSGIAHATLSAPAAPSARAVLTPPPAWQGQAANTDTIAIDPVVQVMDAGGGASGEILSVTADSTTGLTGMTMHLLDAATDQELLRLPMSAPVNPPVSGPSTWTSPVISQARLPLGIYNVAVDATDGGGTSVSYQPAGTFAFQETPSIAPVPADLVITHDNRTPTISGTVSTVAPGTTQHMAYQGAVMLEDSVLGDQTLPLDGTGHYSYTFLHPQPGEIFSIVVLPNPSLSGGATATAQFDAQTDPVSLAAGLSATAVTYGGKVTVGGTLNYQPGGSYLPLAGQTVRIYDGPDAPDPIATAVTSTTGHFTATLPKEAASVHWVVRAGGASDPYLGSASLTLPMKVSLPTAVSGFQVALSMFGQLSFRGCLALPAGVPGHVPSASGLAIQYAAGPNGPWRTLGAVPAQSGGGCGTGGLKFSGTLSARLSYAYYRAWYSGATAAGTGYLAATSGRVLVWKYQDRITAFSVSAQKVQANGTLTIKGQLEYYSGTWRGYAGQQVYIILRGAHCTGWCYIRHPSTDSTGRFSATFADPESATWSAEFFGNSTHLATLAPLAYVTVG